YRLLRASASVGLVLELSEGRFSITELGKTLRADVPGSMRDFALALTAPGHWLPWAVWPTWHDPESGKHRRHLASNFSTTTTKIPRRPCLHRRNLQSFRKRAATLVQILDRCRVCP